MSTVNEPTPIKTIDQLRAEAKDLLRRGYDVQLIADVLRLDIAAVRRLGGAECLGCD